MRVLVAPCSFKGTLSATDAAAAMARGVARWSPSAHVDIRPLADGGEGTLEVMLSAIGGRVIDVDARDPFARRRRAPLGVLSDGTSLVEAASAIGLPLVPEAERDPFASSSVGVGDLVRAALDEGAPVIEVALGGTATVDGGLGLLHALGVRALGAQGNVLSPSGQSLTELAALDTAGLEPRLARTTLRGLVDVDSPLLGARGARLYMPQKGASPAQCDALESGLVRFAEAARRATGHAVDVAGGGAAGGLGAALVLLGATLCSGAERVLDAQHVDEALAGCSLALTGEGALDTQTQEGKAIARLSRRCAAAGVPLVAVCGRVAPGAAAPLGLLAAISLMDDEPASADALAHAAGHLERATFEWLTANMRQSPS